MTVMVAFLSTLAGCATSGTQAGPQKATSHMLMIDVEKNPDLRFRIDNFSVPDAAREPFEAAMRRNLAFIQTLPGFQGHLVFEKTGGPGGFNITTMAVWENQEAMDKAVAEVGAFFRRNGIDMPAFVAKHGIKAELGQYSALPPAE